MWWCIKNDGWQHEKDMCYDGSFCVAVWNEKDTEMSRLKWKGYAMENQTDVLFRWRLYMMKYLVWSLLQMMNMEIEQCFWIFIDDVEVHLHIYSHRFQLTCSYLPNHIRWCCQSILMQPMKPFRYKIILIIHTYRYAA